MPQQPAKRVAPFPSAWLRRQVLLRSEPRAFETVQAGDADDARLAGTVGGFIFA